MTRSKTLSIVVLLLAVSLTLSAQTSLVKGLIVDQDGTPLPGVTVVITGTSTGTVTTLDGNYALAGVRSTDTLQYSFIGYETEYRVAGGQQNINIVFKQSAESLEEVQIVAFQKQKKESVIGSINTINPDELIQAPTNITASLAGRIAGVISYQRSGEPGADNAEFFVRGVTTFGYKNNPLILIDGLEVTSNDLARMEPSSIASFSIMKDATATALYGARGANGVILVTTKEGRVGKARIEVRVESSLATPTIHNEFLKGVDYMELYNVAERTRDNEALLHYSKQKIEGTRRNLDPDIYPDVDWYNELFNNYAINTKANMNVNGGGEVAQYYLSASYVNEEGLLKVDQMNNFNNNIDINRYNLRANININLSKTTKAAVKFNSQFERYNGPSVSANDIFSGVMQANPVNFPKYYEKDETTQYLNHTLFGNKGSGGFPNPYADMVQGYKDRFTSTILSLFQLEQDFDFITEGLKFRGMASVRSYSENESSRSFTPFYYGMGEIQEETGPQHYLYQIQEGTEYLNDPSVYNYANSNFYFELIGQYNRVFGVKHDVGALLVFTRRELLNTLSGSAYSTLPSRNIGLSGRFTYGFDSRFFTEFNFGYNGSEKFAPDHRFGFFPSAGIGWAVSNEQFFQSLKPAISMLKLKATYGLVGNDAISNPNDRFFYLSDVNLNDWGRGHTFGYDYNNSYPGYMISRYPNEAVTWEIAYKLNTGIELGLFNKITLQADYFEEVRSNIYMTWEYVPETMGLTAGISSNIGEARSRGVDASLDYQQAFSNGLWITSRANFTYATSEVISNGEPDYAYDYMSRIGYPINQQWGYVAQRLFVDETELENSPGQFDGSYLAGDIKYVDINEDGRVDELDKVPIGYPTVPEIVYGFGASFGYKTLDFSFFFQGIGRESFFINSNQIAPFVNERNALQVIADDHWSDSNPDPNAFWPRLSVESIYNNEVESTWWIRNGSFLRLKSLEMGYNLPEHASNKIHISALRIYASATNIFSISKFDLWDPEMAGNGLGYPPQRLINLGIQITL
jgi:TonB-linked SusC/RagA family outer membrane protein